MWIDSDYKEIGPINELLFDPLLSLIKDINWNKKEYHRLFHEIPLRNGRVLILPFSMSPDITYTTEQQAVIDCIAPITQIVTDTFFNLKIIRGELGTLPPGSYLRDHFDDKVFHERCVRVHVPITTNDQCFQIFEGRKVHFNTGKIYEINNRIMHSANNEGKTIRTHLILDLLDQNDSSTPSDLIKTSIPSEYRNLTKNPFNILK